jgi:prepilin-type N-terminal cleavage/methylation domain-containing protein
VSKWKQQRAGFTLIELLVVVVIIGILASIGVGQLSSAQDKARNSAVISGTRSIFLGMENWKADYPGHLPTDLIGSDETKYLAAPAGSGGSFSGRYTPGNMLPIPPWSTMPQEAMDPTFNNAGTAGLAHIGQKIAAGDPLPMSQGFFADGGGTNGAPPAAGHGCAKRDDFGYYYYCGDVNSGRYALFGVGKYKKEARVFAVKANFF